MIVVNTQPFALVFAFFQHPYLGWVLEPHVVQMNSKGAYTLTHQRIFSKTSDYFSSGISKEDYELIKILDEVDDDFLFRRFNTEVKRKIRTAEFFQKYCSKELMEETIRPYIEQRMNKVLQQLRGKTVYKIGNDNNPTSVKLTIGDEQANIWFHFKNSPEGIRYYPTLRYKNQKVEFMYKSAQIISQNPAWLMVENLVLDFEKNIDGKKLLPFMNKRYIQIPKKSEETYLSKFVLQLVEKYDVKTDCFTIKTDYPKAKAVLNMQSLYDEEVALRLEFHYGDVVFDYASDQEVMARLSKQGDKFHFDRIARNKIWEETKAEALLSFGLLHAHGAYFSLPVQKQNIKQEGFLGLQGANKYVFLDWLNTAHEQLEAAHIEVKQNNESAKFYIGPRELKIEVNERKDWFDVNAIARFGDYTFSFIALREYILKGKREFILPNGLIAIIPEEWFGNLSGILEFSKSDDEIQLEKHHIGLLEELANNGGRYLRLSDKLSKMISYGQLREMELPSRFEGSLRPYQKGGFDWFYFLKDNQFGGCLADDMGLGKTIQTLALLQKERELFLESQKKESLPGMVSRAGTLLPPVGTQLNIFDQASNVNISSSQPNNGMGAVTSKELYLQTGGVAHHSTIKNKQEEANKESETHIRTSLIVVPNSLIFNWYNEARRFTPDLKILVYTGINRIKNARYFVSYDLIITTYGTVRVDLEIFKDYKFNYIILDESQAIKNANSQVSKAVKLLHAARKLVLTGTPIENSVQELWSQMSFVNPGLLGSLQSFSERFVFPIEKQKDVMKMQQLKAIINPFILRRTKDQVAKDLPAKMEQVVYCEMGEEQAEQYEKVKSHFRNEIIKSLRELGVGKSQFTLLQGLTKLRQIANHPKLINEEYTGDCGKFDEVISMAQTALAENHKVLMFSQFVSQLTIIVNG